MEQARYYFLCAVSGLTWGGIAYLLLPGHEWFPGLWGGIVVSPFIGLLIGLVHRPTYAFPLILRAFLALFTLYAAVTVFGLVVGAVEAVTENNPNTIENAINDVTEWVLATLWGVTFAGYVLFLWPLAFANHWLLGRTLKE